MKRAIFLILLAISAQGLFAQKYYGDEAFKKAYGCKEVWQHPTRHFISYLKPADSTPIPEGTHLKWLSKALLFSPEYSLVAKQTEKDELGFTHYRYNILYRGTAIQNAVYYVHVKNGIVQTANGEYPVGRPIATTAAIKQDVALAAAIKKFGTHQLQQEKQEKPVLVYVEEKGKMHLTYKFDLYSAVAHQREYIFVDATNGSIVRTRNRICTNDVSATAYTLYNGLQTFTTDRIGSQYRLYETGRGGGISTTHNGNEFYNTSTIWNTTLDQTNAAYDVHFGIEATYDFYKSQYGRNGWDNLNATINANYLQDELYDNAFWDGGGITFGDGNGVDLKALTSVDIVGHEYTHAVTQYTAGLDYFDESGDLNESFSDIFGTAINFHVHPTTANFLLGAVVNTSGTPFRDMSNPNNTFQPDTYMGDYWDPTNEPHQNGTVQSFWYYLLVNGGTGVNDNGDSYQVTGIGMKKATDIAYRNLSVYLYPSSTYQDAAAFAIQAAIDLYGACSPEVIACTNAWHAVGIGHIYTNAVLAGFTADKTFSCDAPTAIQFTNLSSNASNCRWDFGDGQTSTQYSPTHTYTAYGNYTVKLVVSGSSNCGVGSDSVTIPSYITVTQPTSVLPAATCSPATVDLTGLSGITSVYFGALHNNSPGSTNGYEDFTCQYRTSFTEGSAEYMELELEGYNEVVKVWIDANNDGAFDNSELVLTSIDNNYSMYDYLTIPHPAVYNTPLRMRIGCDYGDNTQLSTACTPSNYGQYEDYSIIIAPNTSPPMANFMADYTTVSTGDTVQFTDLSLNGPTSWMWSFPGGTPSTSTAQNPKVVYNTAGGYDVTLKVSNANGSDSVTGYQYINVGNYLTMCRQNGSNAISGTVYDPGGPNGYYGPDENCGFLIDLECQYNMSLYIDYLYLSQYNGDTLYLYDGSDSNAPLLGKYWDYASTYYFNSTSNKVFIVFHSDNFDESDGFSITWQGSINGNTIIPVAQFAVSNTSPNVNTNVIFTDNSMYFPNTWLWDFGDGTGSTIAAPRHSYQHPGTYTVLLTAGNCLGSTTSSTTITVLNTGIDDIATTTDIKLFPNPTEGQFQLELSGSLVGVFSVAIVTIDGKQVYNGTITKETSQATATINVTGMASGIYTVTLTAPNGAQYHQKLMVE